MGTIINESIYSRIYEIRGRKVMLDRDLALLYGVATKRLNEQVKRNKSRFPNDFMFQLDQEEFDNWKSQIATSNSDKMGLRRSPYAFTEHGILMLSSVLNSEKAIQVNIQIMRTFSKLREMIMTNTEFKSKIESLEKKYDQQFKVIFEALNHVLYPKTPPKKFGFLPRDTKPDGSEL